VGYTASPSEMESFQYSPLPAGDDSIRILTVLPGEDTDEIQCELSTRKLEAIAAISDNETYEALSYCWGKQDAEMKISIREKGCPRNGTFALRPDLYAALRVFRLKEKARRLWIDAICIDQTNTEEKNVQVPLMRRIYEGCSGVLIWLGERIQNCDSEVAISLIRKLKDAATRPGVGVPKINVFSSHDLVKYGLPPLLSSDYVSLLSLLEAEWFKRSWIVQEVAVAKKATLFSGTCSTDWADLVQGMDFAFKTKLAFTSHPAVNYHIPIANEAATYRAGECTLLGLLLRHRHCGATDPKDKVYAFLGLTETSAKPQAEVKVDYTQDHRTIFTSVARTIILHDKNLDILSLPALRQGPGIEALPSWVPDWSVPTEGQAKKLRQILGSETGSLANGEDAGYKKSEPFCATNSTLYDLRFAPPHQPTVLATRGHLVDTVIAIGDMYEGYYMPGGIDRSIVRCIRTIFQVQHALSTWENVAELRTRDDNYSCGETVEDAFWQTLVAGNLSEQERQEEGKECLRNEYLKWNEVIKPNWVLQKLGLGFLQIFFMAFALAMTFLVHKKPPASFQDQLQYVMFRRMIRTKRRRYIGLASGDIRQDDEVWLLEGSKVPLIIRKRIGGHGKLIGDAYIHGIMYGEAFHRSDCEDLMLE